MTYKLLLVDDDQENLKINSQLLEANGYQVTQAISGLDAIKAIKNAKRDFALVLMDYHMPGMTGAESVIEMKKIKPEQQILAFSLDDTREVMRETFKAGVIDFIDKNSDNDALLSTVRDYCARFESDHRRIEPAITRDEREKEIHAVGMIGRSESLFQLARAIGKIGPTRATTLILGESGTGKELVAKALHLASDRAKGPFVAVNIAAEAATLLDSSLFGHRKGAFTGASHDQMGKFQLANKGTLFLDEIGDMNLDLQVKLLRVLQEREVQPVGSLRPIPIDVRIVAATHKNLKKMVAEGTFREDLYYRLSGVTLATTPLRERLEDIEPLVASFVDEVCRQNSVSRSFHRGCLEVFHQYSWKGNIRELRSCVESHLLRCEVPVIRAEHLDERFTRELSPAAPRTMEDMDARLEIEKKNFVLEAVNSSHSKADASRRLGITPTQLQYFLSKWKK